MSSSSPVADILSVAEGIIHKLADESILDKYSDLKTHIMVQHATGSPSSASQHAAASPAGSSGGATSVSAAGSVGGAMVGDVTARRLFAAGASVAGARVRGASASSAGASVGAARGVVANDMLLTANAGQADAVVNERVLRRSAAVIRQCAESLERFQVGILPSFHVEDLDRLYPLDAGYLTDSTIDRGLGRDVARVERAINVIQMLVEAKLESTALIRTKLKDENTTLRTQVDQSLVAGKQRDLALGEREQEMQRQQDHLRRELGNLHEMYQTERQHLEAQLRERQDRLMAGEEARRELEDEVVREKQVSERLRVEMDEIRTALSESEGHRAELLGEVKANKIEMAAMRRQVDAIRREHKFLGRTVASAIEADGETGRGATGGDDPKTRIDLTRTIERLMGELEKGKAEREALEARVVAAERASIARKFETATIHPVEVDMAAAGLASDDDVVAKLLRAKLQAR